MKGEKVHLNGDAVLKIVFGEVKSVVLSQIAFEGSVGKSP